MPVILVESDAPGLLEHWIEAAGDLARVRSLAADDWADPARFRPSLIVLGGALQGRQLNWPDPGCPVIGFVGDACGWSDHGQVYRNMPYVTELYGSGMNWTYVLHEHVHKFRYHHLCNDRLFQPLRLPRQWDWAFVGQSYGTGNVRTRLVLELLRHSPNGFVGGPGWAKFDMIPWAPEHVPIGEVNQIYARSHAVLSVDIDNGTGYTSNRTIMAMCGGHNTVIYRHQHLPPFTDLAQESVHALYCRTGAEAATRIEQIKAGVDVGPAARQLVLQQQWTLSQWTRTLVERFIKS